MKTIDLLKNLYHNYRQKRLSNVDKLRWLGGMEAYLIELGFLQVGGFPFDFKRSVLLKFWVIKITVRENYEEFIIRHVKEAINGKAI